eukprot:scaffold85846_cov40-Cyclotella_meneghiniana.AAC.3
MARRNDFLFTEYSTAARWHNVHQADEHLQISGVLSAADLHQYLPTPPDPEEDDDTTQQHTNITAATGEDGAPEEKDQDAYAIHEMYETERRHHEDLLHRNDGFAMLDRLLTRLRGDAAEHRVLAITDLAALEFTATDTSATYMARLRGIQSALAGVTIDQIICLFALNKLDTGLYPGVSNLFLQGDNVLLNEDLSAIELRLEREDRLRIINGVSAESARRAKPANKSTNKSPSPAPSPLPSMYPPAKPTIAAISTFVKDTTNCPGCFNKGKGGENCRKNCCYSLLCNGFILKYDPGLADKTLSDIGAKAKARQEQQQPPQGKVAKEVGTPALTPQPAEGAKRATSVEPPSSKTPASYADAVNANKGQNYYDDLASDSDDDLGHFIPDDADDKFNSQSAPYTNVSARRAAVPHTFSAIANKELKTMKIALKSADEAVCCADSGATRHMFPDYKTFLSYHKCDNKYVELGDSTRLPILGYGTAKFSLNGHIILVRDALHVPGLTDPLYSLCQQRFMKGCATTPTIDYAEPRHLFPAFGSARPAHLIPADTDDDDATVMSNIKFHIPTPKTTPASSTPEPSQPTRPPSPTSVITDLEFGASASEPLSQRLLSSIHHDPTQLPPLPPTYTPGPCENRTQIDGLKLHKIFGCRKLRNQSHLIASSLNASLLAGGELPSTIGDFTTINMPNRGKPLKKRRKFLDKVHMDIVYGDCVALGGYRYALILVDLATRYAWFYGMHTMSSADIILALETFKADTGSYPKTFHADFDQKLIGGAALRHINKHSRIIAAPARRQSSNGLVESTWKTAVRMARAYITEKQVSREFWFFAIRHALIMMNQIPGRLGRRLTTPHELVYGTKPDSSTWFELFSVGYFDHKTENSATKSNSEVQMLAGIAVGRDEKSNTIRFYNPLTKADYSPPAFKLDEGCEPLDRGTNNSCHTRQANLVTISKFAQILT